VVEVVLVVVLVAVVVIYGDGRGGVGDCMVMVVVQYS